MQNSKRIPDRAPLFWTKAEAKLIETHIKLRIMVPPEMRAEHAQRLATRRNDPKEDPTAARKKRSSTVSAGTDDSTPAPVAAPLFTPSEKDWRLCNNGKITKEELARRFLWRLLECQTNFDLTNYEEVVKQALALQKEKQWDQVNKSDQLACCIMLAHSARAVEMYSIAKEQWNKAKELVGEEQPLGLLCEMGSAKNHELMEETAEMFECYKRVTDSASFADVPKEIKAAAAAGVARASSRLSEWDEAASSARLMLELDGDQPVAHRLLGDALLELGETVDGLESLQCAAELAAAVNDYQSAISAILRQVTALVLLEDVSLQDVQRVLLRARRWCKHVSNKQLQCDVLACQAELAAAMGDAKSAQDFVEQAVQLGDCNSTLERLQQLGIGYTTSEVTLGQVLDAEGIWDLEPKRARLGGASLAVQNKSPQPEMNEDDHNIDASTADQAHKDDEEMEWTFEQDEQLRCAVAQVPASMPIIQRWEAISAQVGDGTRSVKECGRRYSLINRKGSMQ